MAIISVLVGGIAGFISFLMAFFVYDYSILGAFGLYFGVGLLVATSLIISGMISTEISRKSMTFVGPKTA